ncbi:hypothetical protein EV193_106350 [Herbihabitans rhizosphaerae]|uniref:Uncharacterized protein n=1 Tax=Herbihabitans rhizosphaerae TaxID=1872711 RepID=A0A4Q7KPC5_9PSEU|nr:hypothetical protein [Herbihabitans rhizosphaerae]RZS37112.1 hypothetical protein EV193_106350 [Herbihabitans rhizosphaerae]
MKIRSVLALSLAAVAITAAPAAAGHRPDPAPGGPKPPVEPVVDGPRNLDDLSVAAHPDGGTRDGVVVAFDRTSRTATGEKPAPATRFVFLFDKSIRFNPEKFPTCARADYEAGGPAACPPGSKVGQGVGTFYPSGEAEVAVFNTVYPNGLRGVLITVPAVGGILENTFEPVSAPYRGTYAWGSDELVISALPPQQRSATTRFRVSFGAVIRNGDQVHSFAESDAPRGRDLRFGLWSRFVTGQVALPQTWSRRD